MSSASGNGVTREWIERGNTILRQELNAKRKNAVGYFEVVIKCASAGSSSGSSRRGGSNANATTGIFYCHSAILNQYEFFEKKYFESTPNVGQMSIELDGYSSETVENILEYIYTQDKECLKVTANNFEEILKLAKEFTIPKNEISILSLMELDQVKRKPQLISALRKFMQRPEFKDEFCELNYPDMKQIFDSIQNYEQKKKLYLDWISFKFDKRRHYYNKEFKQLFPSDDSENSSDEQAAADSINGSASGSGSQVYKPPGIKRKKTLVPRGLVTPPACGGIPPTARRGRKRGIGRPIGIVRKCAPAPGTLSLPSESESSDYNSEPNESSGEESVPEVAHSSMKGGTGNAKVINLELCSDSDNEDNSYPVKSSTKRNITKTGSPLPSTSAKRTRTTPPKKSLNTKTASASPKIKNGGTKVLIPRSNNSNANENKPWLIYTASTNKEVFMEAFNPEIASSNRRIHQFSNPREYSGLAYVDGVIYHIGGNKNNNLKTFCKTIHMNATFPSTNEVDVFNYQHFLSLVEPDLKIPKLEKNELIERKGINAFSSVVHNEYIYLIGGNHSDGDSFGNLEVTNGVARLNTSTKTWENCKDLEIARGWHASIILNDVIYVMGGQAEEEVLNSVEVWDLNSKRKWRLLEKKFWMNDYRTCFRAFTWNGLIYVAGGCGQFGIGELWTDKIQNTVEVFDPKREENGWTRKKNMIRNREDFGVWTCEDSIYVIGGENKNYPKPSFITMEKYDPNKDEWTLMLNVSFPAGSNFHSSITIPANYIRLRDEAEDETQVQ